MTHNAVWFVGGPLHATARLVDDVVIELVIPSGDLPEVTELTDRGDVLTERVVRSWPTITYRRVAVRLQSVFVAPDVHDEDVVGRLQDLWLDPLLKQKVLREKPEPPVFRLTTRKDMTEVQAPVGTSSMTDMVEVERHFVESADEQCLVELCPGRITLDQMRRVAELINENADDFRIRKGDPCD